MDDGEGFSETSRCMESIGLGPEAQEGVFRVRSHGRGGGRAARKGDGGSGEEREAGLEVVGKLFVALILSLVPCPFDP